MENICLTTGYGSKSNISPISINAGWPHNPENFNAFSEKKIKSV